MSNQVMKRERSESISFTRENADYPDTSIALSESESCQQNSEEQEVNSRDNRREKAKALPLKRNKKSNTFVCEQLEEEEYEEEEEELKTSASSSSERQSESEEEYEEEEQEHRKSNFSSSYNNEDDTTNFGSFVWNDIGIILYTRLKHILHKACERLIMSATLEEGFMVISELREELRVVWETAKPHLPVEHNDRTVNNNNNNNNTNSNEKIDEHISECVEETELIRKFDFFTKELLDALTRVMTSISHDKKSYKCKEREEIMQFTNLYSINDNREDSVESKNEVNNKNIDNNEEQQTAEHVNNEFSNATECSNKTKEMLSLQEEEEEQCEEEHNSKHDNSNNNNIYNSKTIIDKRERTMCKSNVITSKEQLHLCKRLLRLLDKFSFAVESGSIFDALCLSLQEASDLNCYSYQRRSTMSLPLLPRYDTDKRTDEEHSKPRIGYTVTLPLPHPHPEINTEIQLIEPRKRRPMLDEYRIFSHPKKAVAYGADDFLVDEELLFRAYVILTFHLDTFGSLDKLSSYVRTVLWQLVDYDMDVFNSLISASPSSSFSSLLPSSPPSLPQSSPPLPSRELTEQEQEFLLISSSSSSSETTSNVIAAISSTLSFSNNASIASTLVRGSWREYKTQLHKLRERLVKKMMVMQLSRQASRRTAQQISWYAISAQWRDQMLCTLAALDDGDWCLLGEVHQTNPAGAIFPNYTAIPLVCTTLIQLLRKLDNHYYYEYYKEKEELQEQEQEQKHERKSNEQRHTLYTIPVSEIVQNILLPFLSGHTPQLSSLDMLEKYNTNKHLRSHAGVAWERLQRHLRTFFDGKHSSIVRRVKRFHEITLAHSHKPLNVKHEPNSFTERASVDNCYNVHGLVLPHHKRVCAFITPSMVFALQCVAEMLEMCALMRYAQSGMSMFSKSFIGAQWNDEEGILAYLLKREAVNVALAPLIGLPKLYKDLVTGVQLMAQDNTLKVCIEARRLAEEASQVIRHSHIANLDKDSESSNINKNNNSINNSTITTNNNNSEVVETNKCEVNTQPQVLTQATSMSTKLKINLHEPDYVYWTALTNVLSEINYHDDLLTLSVCRVSYSVQGNEHNFTKTLHTSSALTRHNRWYTASSLARSPSVWAEDLQEFIDDECEYKTRLTEAVEETPPAT